MTTHEPEVLDARLTSEPSFKMFFVLYPDVKPEILLGAMRIAYALGRMDGGNDAFNVAQRTITKALQP